MAFASARGVAAVVFCVCTLIAFFQITLRHLHNCAPGPVLAGGAGGGGAVPPAPPLIVGAAGAGGVVRAWGAGEGSLPRDSGGVGGGGGGVARSDVCSAFEPLGLYKQAEADFVRYSGPRKLTEEQAAAYVDWCQRRARTACLTIVITGGRIFVRQFIPGYQSRHRSTLHALYRVAQRFGPLPDAQLVIEVTDGSFSEDDLPVFMITRRRDRQVGILYPDFTFYSWPEAVCPPERSHAYGFLFDAFAREAKEAEKPGEAWWAGKKDQLFWRGGVIANPERTAAVQALAGRPGVDVGFVAWRNVSITGKNGVPGCAGLLEHCRYKYLAFLNGNTYSSRFKYELLCGSCVFASNQTWIEWWSHLFVPNEDFVAVRPDFHDAERRLAEVRAQPDGGRGFAERSRRKALALLSEDAVDCYWRRLIALASEHLPRPSAGPGGVVDGLPAAARPIEDVLLYPDNAAITDGGVFGPVQVVG